MLCFAPTHTFPAKGFKMQLWELLTMLVCKFQQWDFWVVVWRGLGFCCLFGFFFLPTKLQRKLFLERWLYSAVWMLSALQLSRADAWSTAENRGELWGWQGWDQDHLILEIKIRDTCCFPACSRWLWQVLRISFFGAWLLTQGSPAVLTVIIAVMAMQKLPSCPCQRPFPATWSCVCYMLPPVCQAIFRTFPPVHLESPQL